MKKPAKKSKRGRGFLLPAIHGVASGVSLYKAVRDLLKSKQQKQGNGFFLKPYKKFAGKGLKSGKKGKKKGGGIKKKKNKNKKRSNSLKKKKFYLL